MFLIYAQDRVILKRILLKSYQEHARISRGHHFSRLTGDVAYKVLYILYFHILFERKTVTDTLIPYLKRSVIYCQRHSGANVSGPKHCFIDNSK